MELRQLESLVALAEECHFTRAAARVHLAQPAFSQQIKRLEQELGLALVDRTTRRVAMTHAGSVLAARARRILAEVDAAREDIEDLKGLATGQVVLGLTPTLGAVDVTALLAGFNGAYPGVSLLVREGLSAALVDQLAVDAIDIAFVTRPKDRDLSGLRLEPLETERLVAVFPAGHRLARRRRLALADLREERFVLFPPGATIRDLVLREAAEAGFTPEIALEAIDVQRLRSFVSAGLGVSVLPSSDATAPGPDVRVVPLAGGAFVHEVVVAVRAGRRLGPAARALLAASSHARVRRLGGPDASR